jgi:hypothetical protein
MLEIENPNIKKNQLPLIIMFWQKETTSRFEHVLYSMPRNG